MPDREDRLERELRELGARLEYPPTPDVSERVRSMIEEEEHSRRRGFFSYLPSAKWAAAAAVVVLTAVPALSPEFRDTVSGWFVYGSGGSAGEVAQEPGRAGDVAESAGPEATPSGEADSPASSSGAAERITLEEARSRIRGLLVLPELGAPEEIQAVGGGGVTLVYDAPDLTLTQRPGEVETAFPATRSSGAEYATVNGEQGYWLPSGTLFWERDGLALRLRSDLSKEAAIQLAESVR
ncbi:MAG: hypothetical protein ACRDSJ_18335, partial [Rubrobacteraceae bacterium]